MITPNKSLHGLIVTTLGVLIVWSSESKLLVNFVVVDVGKLLLIAVVSVVLPGVDIKTDIGGNGVVELSSNVLPLSLSTVSSPIGVPFSIFVYSNKSVVALTGSAWAICNSLASVIFMTIKNKMFKFYSCASDGIQWR